MNPTMEQAMNEPLYARVGRQVPLHGTLVPLHDETAAMRDTQHLRRMTVAMAALAVAGVVALGVQLVHAATRPAPTSGQDNAQNVGAELATALHSRAAASPAADAAADAAARADTDTRRP
jgi:hypothetical protein